MLRDRFGNIITGASADAIDAFDTYGDDWLGYGTRIAQIFNAADASPGSAYLNAHAAAAHMGLEAASGFRAAEPYLARAKATAQEATTREQCFVETVDAWWQKKPQRAVDLQRHMAQDWPQDLVAAKWGQYFAFNLGDSDAMLAIAEAIRPAHEDVSYAHGMHAFGLEQCHRLAEAEAAGRKAVLMNRGEAWAHHAVAHVMETQGRVAEGVAWLEDHSDTWDDRSIFIREHNWWHVALFKLDLEDYNGVLEIFDRRLWGEWPDFSQEQIGAISMLWRLELRGIDVGNRWGPVADKVAARELEHLQPFLDLHYIFALARAGRVPDVEHFLDSMSRHADQLDEAVAPIWQNIALPAAKAIAHYASDQSQRAYPLMKEVMPHLQAIGGSHAQRDVFVQTWIDVLMRSERCGEAAPLLAERVKARPGVAVLQRLMTTATSAMAEPAPSVAV